MNHASNSNSEEKLLEKLEKRLLDHSLDKQSIELSLDEWNQILQWGRTANKSVHPLAIYTPSKTWMPSDVVVFETLDFIDSEDANEGTDKQYHFMFLYDNKLYDFYFDKGVKGVYDNGFRFHSWWPYAVPDYATSDTPHDYWWDLSEQLIPNEFHETCENTYKYTGEQDAETYLKSKGYKFISLINVDQEDEQEWESYLPKEWMQ